MTLGKGPPPVNLNLITERDKPLTPWVPRGERPSKPNSGWSWQLSRGQSGFNPILAAPLPRSRRLFAYVGGHGHTTGKRACFC